MAIMGLGKQSNLSSESSTAMASPLPCSLPPRLSLISKTSPPQHDRLLLCPTRPDHFRFECRGRQTGFFTRLGRLIKEKANSDVEKLFSGFSKTRDNLAVVDKLLLYWNLADTNRVLDELEEALLVSDFGPKITIKIVESLREDIVAGKLKSGSEIKGNPNSWQEHKHCLSEK